MPVTSLTMRDASRRLAHYATQAAAGQEFIITRHGKAVARSLPMEPMVVASVAEAAARRIRVAKALAVRAARPYPRARFARADAHVD